MVAGGHEVLSTETLLNGLNSVTTIPLVPFRGGAIDYEAHQKNIHYLMNHNALSDRRPRVVCVAGTSLIHHIGLEDQTKLLRATAEAMGTQGILLSAIMPNPLESADKLLEVQTRLPRPPDAYLLMPLSGVYSNEGLFQEFSAFVHRWHAREGARFLYYMRQSRELEPVVRLVTQVAGVVGAKVGTRVEDIPAMVQGIGESGIVIWGVGDRSTQAARLGATGHTSGISVFVAKAGDTINNAQRDGDYQRSEEVERRIEALEEIRFENGRAYNYSAVVEAMLLSQFTDVDPGEGGPFNPRVPKEIADRIATAIEGILDLH